MHMAIRVDKARSLVAMPPGKLAKAILKQTPQVNLSVLDAGWCCEQASQWLWLAAGTIVEGSYVQQARCGVWVLG